MIRQILHASSMAGWQMYNLGPQGHQLLAQVIPACNVIIRSSSLGRAAKQEIVTSHALTLSLEVNQHFD